MHVGTWEISGVSIRAVLCFFWISGSRGSFPLLQKKFTANTLYKHPLFTLAKAHKVHA